VRRINSLLISASQIHLTEFSANNTAALLYKKKSEYDGLESIVPHMCLCVTLSASKNAEANSKDKVEVLTILNITWVAISTSISPCKGVCPLAIRNSTNTMPTNLAHLEMEL